MLLKAAKKLSCGDVLMPDIGNDELIHIAKRELAQKLVEMMYEKDLVRTEIRLEQEAGRPIVTVTAIVRAYNPDD